MEAGSSPLARGLLTYCAHGRPVRRIIPARAGFTLGRSGWTCALPDHPRSRGVYECGDNNRVYPAGSSPLARGLRNLIPTHRISVRIIPARAGFTVAVFVSRWIREDHPRSRGVYLASSGNCFCVAGSSPLARGLRMSISASFLEMRIIPARAGFTRRRHAG